MIYGTITDELYDVISAQDSTAYHAWFLLNAFFRDNLAGRAIHVGAEFRATVQGDMKIAEYCRRLKALADSLDDLDEHVTDKTLTLQLIRGLTPQFGVMASLLPMQVPFPTFVQARSRLMPEEISLDVRARAEGGHRSPRHPWRLVWLRQLQWGWRRLCVNWRHHPASARSFL
ncbi:uncharacterized protein [Aegilops tauschii subsp. strangulata]|uniref:uncharacterized protein n=1 Tax=Aegilops tauschii subsp. strangulata TaxID=200361 RepID=UPI00098B9468|nr:uncharacterized protein LOC109781910 [Aegilops tauschii subsp. strangulata]